MSNQLTTQTEKMKSVRDMLARPDIQAQIRDVLPAHVTPEKLAALTLTQIRTTPKLLDCTQSSLLGAVLESSKLDLLPPELEKNLKPGPGIFPPVRVPGKTKLI